MRSKDVLTLLAPVVIVILALLLVPAVLLPSAPPLSPPKPPAATASGGQPSNTAQPSTAPPAAATPAAASGGSGSGATPAPAATPAAAPAALAAGGAGNAGHGAQLFLAKGCSGCHTIADIPGAVGKVGPELTHVATNAATRKPGMSAEAYIRESIENPTAYTVEGFPAGVMPPKLVSGSDEDDVVAMLLAHT